jgi:EthD domain-containing protein
MIKLVYVIRKRADVSEKDFHEYWLKHHGPLVRRFAKAMQAKKYVQSHTIMEDAGREFRASRKMTETCDGITEVWWDSFAEMTADPQNPQRLEAARALVEDESKFIDFARSSIFLTEEHEIFDYTK